MNILIPLGAFLSAGVGFLAIRALTGVGVGLISYGAVLIVIEQLFSLAQGYYNNIPAFALQIVGLAGFGQAIGIIAGAITFRATFVFMSRLGVIPK
ncbi:MAG: DUF2523 domain-containing protein [Gammaproteobacteria bacterium]|jgi:hypothetical protein|nr:DUF2523 domain-containing protein [Pseudomonadota bacterium]QOJ19400.1 MAG: DUF2523 domain-containing protein [Gammaproteobacteria bacterium]